MKHCTACKGLLDDGAFSPDLRMISKLASACRLCTNKRSQANRRSPEHKIRTKAYMAIWHSKNLALNSKTHDRWLESNVGRCKAHSSNAIAKRRFGVKPIPTDDLLRLLESSGGKCGYCGGSKTVGFDHRVPMFRGGPHALDNLITCCMDCNRTKGRLSETDFRSKCARLGIKLI